MLRKYRFDIKGRLLTQERAMQLFPAGNYPDVEVLYSAAKGEGTYSVLFKSTAEQSLGRAIAKFRIIAHEHRALIHEGAVA